jgi:hypothetical protein
VPTSPAIPDTGGVHKMAQDSRCRDSGAHGPRKQPTSTTTWATADGGLKAQGRAGAAAAKYKSGTAVGRYVGQSP